MKGEGLTSKFIGIYEYSKKSPEFLGSSGFFIYLCKQLVELHASRREGNC